MDIHSLNHTLAGQVNNGKQHPVQLHHTLQPLVSTQTLNTPSPPSTNNTTTINPQQHQMYQFQHHQPQAMHQQQHPNLHHHNHHPYSTLHHQQPHHHQHNQHQHLNHPNHSLQDAASPPNNYHQTSGSQTMHFAPSSSLSQQQHSQQQQYNLNSSDYSSSTYHIYDQISDLIIIKQQRLERKRQLEHRRKVILFSLAAIILVSTSIFLLIQSLWSNVPVNLPTSSLSQHSRDEPTLGGLPRPPWAPPGGGQQRPDRFDGSQFPQPPPPFSSSSQEGASSPSNDGNWKTFLPKGTNKVILPTSEQVCSNHGVIVISGGMQLCKCDQGFWGDRCQEYNGATTTTANQQLLAKCLLVNCNNNGKCNSQGRCQCFPGFIGTQCEFRMPSSISPSNNSPNQYQQASASSSASSVIAPSSPVLATETNDDKCSLTLNNCNGNGHCTPRGDCKCLAGFTGESCQDRDLCSEQRCSNQGICLPASGVCQCKFGFKGQFCEIRDDEQWQRLLNCSNHGKFDYAQRKCNCDQGFAGLDCSEERCELIGEQQLIDCGPNGLFDCRQNKCVCQDGYSGAKCQVQQCSPQCLRNGQCVDGTCSCAIGYYGKHCTLNGCPNQCSGRGQCVRVAESVWPGGPSSNQQSHSQQAEWRCQCQAGSSGEDCSVLIERQCDDGIDNDKDGLVDCMDSECCSDKVCQNSTLCMKSPDPLDILMRKQPPPPTSSFFQRMQFLIEKFSSQIYSNPRDFNDSLLTSKHVDRASVIRGRVTYLKQGVTGVRVSVAGQTNLGITLTRDGGYFDLMVNGGGAVIVEFRREPFATHQKTVRVPWNEIVLMDLVELQLDSQIAAPPSNQPSLLSFNPIPEPDIPICSAHNYRILRPLITTGPKSSRRSRLLSRGSNTLKPISTSSMHQRAVILRDSAMAQQSITLPNSSDQRDSSSNESVSLVYISSRANEFATTINIQLTPIHFRVPDELRLVHLKITIEGNLYEQLFEPQTNLSFTYAWNRRNVYRQKSFGLSTASVSVGYEYYDCKHVIWSTKHIQLLGHDLSISDIGSQWNLNIHHRYNYRDAILQRGDGQNFNLKTDKPRIVQQVMGDGYQRQPICPYCDGSTNPTEQRLFKPQALVSGHDGSLYIGDYNLIRKIESATSSTASSDRVVRTILDLPTNRVPSKYSLTLNPADQKLYMNDIDRHQVFLIREQSSKQATQVESMAFNETTSTPSSEESLIAVVGNGQKCPLDGRMNCGDGQSARTAQLIEPKAIVFDLSNRMYIADGPNVRLVDADQKIYTILGGYGATRHTKFPCSGEAIPMHKFVPKSPIDLAINPIDDTLHVLDDNVVYKITQDKRVQVVAGRLSHCPYPSEQQPLSKSKPLSATEAILQSAQSIVFNQNGDLFISEDDQIQSLARVLLVSPEDDTIVLYAGLPADNRSSSSQMIPTSDSIHLDEDIQQAKQRSSNVLPLNQPTRAPEYKFNSVGAIAVDQLGNLIVADKIQLRVVSIEPDLPQINSAGEYELDNGDEILLFNRFGHHIATRETSSSVNKYTFTYNVNTPFGQLASVSYLNGNKISIYRDGPHHSVKMIETAFGGQCKLDITRNGQVQSISTTGSNKTSFWYHVEGGLLRQSRDQATGETFEFSYDEFGRAISIQHSSSKMPASVECRVGANYVSQQCSSLIVP